MKNFVAPGNTITAIAPEAVVSGQLVLVGAMAGVANGDAALGAPVELSVEGVFDLAKTPGDAFTQGAVAKALIATGVIDSGGHAKRRLGYSGRCGWRDHGTRAIGAGALKAKTAASPGGLRSSPMDRHNHLESIKRCGC